MSRRIFKLTDRVLVIDAETASPVNLKKAGQYRYWAHEETEVLMLAAQWLEAEPEDAQLIDFEVHKAIPPQRLLPPWFLEAVEAPPGDVMLAAANATFDQMALARIGLPTPDEKWLDVLTLGAVLGFAGGLDQVLDQVGLQKKDPEGTRLITRFSIDREPWYEHPDRWQRFRDYCLQDARVETALLQFCWDSLPHEFYPALHRILKQERIYGRVNARGLPVDLPAVEGALKIRHWETSRLLTDLKLISGVDNPNSRDQILNWCHETWPKAAVELPDLRAETIRDAIQAADVTGMPSSVKRVLELRQQTSASATKKYDALLAATDPVDSRLRGGWRFYGASRTGRVTGRIFNPANIKRPTIPHPEAAAEFLPTGDAELLETLFPEEPPLATLGSTIRAVMKAPPDKRWCVADLTSIESVGAAWLCGCKKILDIFHAGRDSYKTFAAMAEGIPYEDVTPQQRKFYKPPVLAGAYQISGAGLARYAASMGVEMSEDDGYRLVKAFREEYHEIPHYWDRLEEAARKAIKNPGLVTTVTAVARTRTLPETDQYESYQTYEYGKWPAVKYVRHGDFLFCLLPSGRFLSYYRPALHEITIDPIRGRRFTIPEAIHYYGTDQKAPGTPWRLINASGGSLLENITQALCRDILWYGLESIEADDGLYLVGDVYDEALTLADENDTTALERLIDYLTRLPPWADPSFFLGADGYISRRYGKQ